MATVETEVQSAEEAEAPPAEWAFPEMRLGDDVRHYAHVGAPSSNPGRVLAVSNRAVDLVVDTRRGPVLKTAVTHVEDPENRPGRVEGHGVFELGPWSLAFRAMERVVADLEDRMAAQEGAMCELAAKVDEAR